MHYDINDLRRRMRRRAAWNDYRGRRIYMITLVKAPSTPVLAVLEHPAPDCYVTRRTEAGRLAEGVIAGIERYHPALRVWKYVVMPDHVHFILSVAAPLPRHMGFYIGQMTADCTLRYARLLAEGTGEGAEARPFFLNGFHDRVLSGKGQLATMKRYIADNPRRAWIKRECPELFTVRRRVTVGAATMDAVGNIFLLHDCEKASVVAHSRYTPDQLEARVAMWKRTADNSGVLVSPFIHPVEKACRDYAISGFGRVIEIRPRGFGPRFKPEGRLFDLCREGRLLLLAPADAADAATAVSMTKTLARRLNAVAEAIAGDGGAEPA